MSADKPRFKNRKTKIEFSPELKSRYLDLFRNDPNLRGCRGLCAEAIGVSLATVRVHLEQDTEFFEAFNDSLQAVIDEDFYLPAVKRAKEGFERPILGGRFKDEVVAHERVYSDGLMLAMLKAHRPEFRDGAQSTNTGNNGGVMIVPSAPITIGDWTEKYGHLASGSASKVIEKDGNKKD